MRFVFSKAGAVGEPYRGLGIDKRMDAKALAQVLGQRASSSLNARTAASEKIGLPLFGLMTNA